MSINVKQNGELTKIAGLYQTTAPVGIADCHSTEEKIVGCWTDGKPLYQKTVDLGSDVTISYNSWTSLTNSDIPISDIENLVSVTGLGSAGGNYGSLMAGVASGGTALNIQTGRNGDNVFVRYITLQYTKTTDTPGSGQWTPSGAPTVHYSTEEQVIGTWIDGSTLYETTVSWPSVTAGGNTLITLSHEISNIAKVINFDFIFGSDSYKFKTIPLADPAWFAMVSAVTQTSVQYRLGTSYSSYGLTITIQYTKITD